jgi:hypothetical protein
LRGGSVFDIRTGRLGTGGTLAEKALQFGLGNLDATVPSVGRAILSTHSCRLAKGPEEMLPSPSIAYQPGFMPRMSDLCSLM